MKFPGISLVVLCALIITGSIIYLDTRKATVPVPAVVQTSPSSMPDQSSSEPITTSQTVKPPSIPAHPVVSVTPPAVPQPPVDDARAAAIAAFHQAIHTLVSHDANFAQRQVVLSQLRAAGELDEAIAALKAGAANSPNDPAYPVALGQTEIYKIYAIQQDGGDAGQIPTLGYQADQSFNAALQIDPANWDAQYLKASAMSYWPAEFNKEPEVIQRLSSLIDQQDTMTPNPEFAQTYALLGDQYQKAGELEYAQQTWNLGLAKFPGNPTLQQKINAAK